MSRANEEGAVMGATADQTNRICSFLPVALANFLSVENEGPFCPEARLLSMRVIAVALVPMSSATCACVSPAFLRAASIESSNSNSSSTASYSVLNAGSFIHSETIWLCSLIDDTCLVLIFYLFQSCGGDAQFFAGRFLCFLDKTVQHDNSFSNDRTEKHTTYPLDALDAQFKQTATECTGMRFTEITADQHHSFCEFGVTDSQCQRPVVYVHADIATVVLNSVVHGTKHNKFVMFNLVVEHPNSSCYTVSAAAKTAVGRSNPEFNTAHNRAQAVFLCVMHSYIQSMVGRAGQPKGWPGSVLTGIATPVRLTTHRRSNFGGELFKFNTEVATMATTPRSPRFTFIFKAVRKNLPSSSFVYLHARTNTERQARKLHENFYDLELVSCVHSATIRQPRIIGEVL